MQRWLSDEPPVPCNDYPQQYHQLIIQQNTIGWSHLFRGRWGTEWGQIHRRYLLTLDTDGTGDGHAWVTTQGKQFIKAWFEIWDTRNKERHGRDEEEQTAKRKERALSHLEELYKLKDKVLPAHRQLFLQDAQTHLNSTIVMDSLEDWITTFTPAIQASAQRAQIIPHYFRRHPP
jgi:hypothetical protein